MDEWMRNGGPAFPVAVDDRYYKGAELRDYFAAKAMDALIHTPHSFTDLGLTPKQGLNNVQLLAYFSFVFADAMLAAREAE